jgi:hypothetical protein
MRDERGEGGEPERGRGALGARGNVSRASGRGGRASGRRSLEGIGWSAERLQSWRAAQRICIQLACVRIPSHVGSPHVGHIVLGADSVPLPRSVLYVRWGVGGGAWAVALRDVTLLSESGRGRHNTCVPPLSCVIPRVPRSENREERRGGGTIPWGALGVRSR